MVIKEMVEEVKKRGRGRPRKQPVVEDEIKEVHFDEIPVVDDDEELVEPPVKPAEPPVDPEEQKRKAMWTMKSEMSREIILHPERYPYLSESDILPCEDFEKLSFLYQTYQLKKFSSMRTMLNKVAVNAAAKPAILIDKQDELLANLQQDDQFKEALEAVISKYVPAMMGSPEMMLLATYSANMAQAAVQEKVIKPVEATKVDAEKKSA